MGELKKRIQEIIEELEKYADADDWVSYDCKYEEFDTLCKTAIIDGLMTSEEYSLLEKNICKKEGMKK